MKKKALIAVAARSAQLMTRYGGTDHGAPATDGRVAGTLADDKVRTGHDLTTEIVAGAAGVAGAQDGTWVVRAAVPSQDPVRGVTTTGGRATVTFRDHP